MRIDGINRLAKHFENLGCAWHVDMSEANRCYNYRMLLLDIFWSCSDISWQALLIKDRRDPTRRPPLIDLSIWPSWELAGNTDWWAWMQIERSRTASTEVVRCRWFRCFLSKKIRWNPPIIWCFHADFGQAIDCLFRESTKTCVAAEWHSLARRWLQLYCYLISSSHESSSSEQLTAVSLIVCSTLKCSIFKELRNASYHFLRSTMVTYCRPVISYPRLQQ